MTVDTRFTKLSVKDMHVIITNLIARLQPYHVQTKFTLTKMMSIRIGKVTHHFDPYYKPRFRDSCIGLIILYENYLLQLEY